MQEAALVGLEGQELDDDFASVGAGRRTAVQDWEDEINQVISTSIKLTRSSPLTLGTLLGNNLNHVKSSHSHSEQPSMSTQRRQSYLPSTSHKKNSRLSSTPGQ